MDAIARAIKLKAQAAFEQMMERIGAGESPRDAIAAATEQFRGDYYAFANRIAQTELHRAYSNQVAQEIMADEAAVWVKYQMSVTHPKVDICD